MFDKSERHILLRFYYLGFISIIITPTVLYLTASITINLDDYVRILINCFIYIFGFYIIPTNSFWFMDLKPIVINSLDYKTLKKVLKNNFKKGFIF